MKFFNQKDKSMNNQFKLIPTLLFLILGLNIANAQCSIVGTNTNNISVTISISCDFPVLVDTGNQEVDAANYAIEKEAWIENHQQDYDAIISLSDAHFEIHQSDLAAMTAGKQTAILANPGQYHIIP